MALPIRDGNQSPTTLSTIIVNNAHIPAHTVASLGAQAVTDIATAVSGVELGPNTLNALENITVTLGQVTITGGLTDAQLRASAVTIGGSVTATISGTASVTFGTAVITGSASILNFPATQTVTFSEASVTFGTAVVTGSTSILNFPATQTVTFTQASVTFSQASVTFGTAVITGSTSILNFPATQAVTFGEAPVTFGTVVVTGSASVLNFPATQTVTFSQASITFGLISGTVTANPTGTQTIAGSVTLGASTAQIGSVTASNLTSALAVYGGGNSDISVNIKSVGGQSFGQGQTWVPVAISEGSLPTGTNRIGVVTIGAGTVTIGAGTAQIGSVTASISGTVPISISSVTIGNSVTIGSLPAISGTVTANNSEWVLLGTRDWNAVTSGWFFSELNQYSSVRLDNGGGGGSEIIAVDSTYNNDRFWRWDGDSRSDGLQTLGFAGGTYTAPVQYDQINFFLQLEISNDPNISKLYAKKNFTNLGLTNFDLRSTPVTISGTVTISNIQGTAVTTSNFTSTTPSTVLAGFNATREVLTIFNEGAGNLHISVGTTCTTQAYQVRLSTGDYYEAPLNQASITHSAVFATAGTARVTEVS
jgi:hypothetical protein